MGWVWAFAFFPPSEAKGERLSILGDSYSTFDGYIPEGNASWYFTNTQNGRTDVTDVRQTWWWQLINEGGFILGSNESYSGATVSYTGYRGEDYADRSFITRLPRIAPSDILLIFGATNDSWVGGPLASIPTSALPAVIIMNSAPLWANFYARLRTAIPAPALYLL